MDTMQGMKRTMYCGEVRAEHIGRKITLMGWVSTARDHGGLIFVDLRDREGIAQVVFNPEERPEMHEKAHSLRSEFVLAISGVVRQRPEGTVNPNIPTGEVEIAADTLKILNTSKPVPFAIEDGTDATDSTRLKHRYLDIRRPEVFKRLTVRHKAAKAVRHYLDSKGFVDVETPALTKSTPEGARDYLVPSRVNSGMFYALPQSPQLFKQILMVAGVDKYYQIVKCFRDEDLRADRQPEFTQIDAEMSFIDREDIYETFEGMIEAIFREVLDIEVKPPFPRLSYADALYKYGVDNPDLRYGLELTELTEELKSCEMKALSAPAKAGGIIKALNAKGCASFSRKELDDLIEDAKLFGAGGMVYIKVNPDGWQSPIMKFLSDDEKDAITKALAPEPGDLLLMIGDAKSSVANDSMGYIRKRLAGKLNLMKEDDYVFTWVTDFPLLEWDEGDKRWCAIHHPFTSPRDEDLDKLESDPGKVLAKAYDLVLNGNEIGGGSIRNHRPEVQERMFKVLGISEEDAREKFSFLLDALSFGAPPHGGIAFGFDRIAMILSGTDSIREVIAFPKTQKAQCLMSGAPGIVDDKQLRELYLKSTFKKAKE